jgi:hypothetical protein
MAVHPRTLKSPRERARLNRQYGGSSAHVEKRKNPSTVGSATDHNSNNEGRSP